MKKERIILLAILIGTLCIDQISKFMVTSNLELVESIDVIPSFFRITYVQNTGGAWSILEGHMLFFYGITIVAVGLMLVYLRNLKDGPMLSKVGVILMISGALGNFIDRLAFEYVRDFLDFLIFGYNFPVFNIADMCLIIGIGLVILEEVLKGLGVYTK